MHCTCFVFIALTLIECILYFLLHHWHPATGGVHPLMDPLASGSPLARLPYPGATLGTPILAHPLTDSEVLRQQLFGEEKAPRPCTCSAFFSKNSTVLNVYKRLYEQDDDWPWCPFFFFFISPFSFVSRTAPPFFFSVCLQVLLSVICPSHLPSLVPCQQRISYRPCSRRKAQSCRSRDWPWNNSGSITITTTPSPRTSITGTGVTDPVSAVNVH